MGRELHVLGHRAREGALTRIVGPQPFCVLQAKMLERHMNPNAPQSLNRRGELALFGTRRVVSRRRKVLPTPKSFRLEGDWTRFQGPVLLHSAMGGCHISKSPRVHARENSFAMTDWLIKLHLYIPARKLSCG
jgi:hypothetical protein